MSRGILIGCAGWSLPAPFAGQFPTSGSHLERYAARFPAVEINSSFYRSHRALTYQRWAAAVPEAFRFAVKVPRLITHERRLVDVEEPLASFLHQISQLASRLGPLLVQLPPSLDFHPARVSGFFSLLRSHFAGAVVCEPRHASWFTADAEEVLERYMIARVSADPPPVPAAMAPGGWSGVIYYRLHGSPRTYYSAYTEAYLEALATNLGQAAQAAQVWCIFDNTANGAATLNAIYLANLLRLRSTIEFTSGKDRE